MECRNVDDRLDSFLVAVCVSLLQVDNDQKTVADLARVEALRPNGCPTSLRIPGVLSFLVALFGSGLAHAQAGRDPGGPCVLTGPTAGQRIQVAPATEDTFEVTLRTDGNLTVTIDREPAPKVEVKTEHLSFVGLGGHLNYHVGATMEVARGALKVASTVPLKHVVASAGGVSCDVEPVLGVRLRDIRLVCSDLEVGALSGFAIKNVSPPRFEGDRLVAARATRLSIFAAPDDADPISVIEIDRRVQLLFETVTKMREWTRVYRNDDGIELLVWSRTEMLRPAKRRSTGSSAVADCAPRRARPASVSSRVTLPRGSRIHSGAGKAAWANVDQPVEVTFEAVPGEHWAQLVAVPDFVEGCWLTHAWIPSVAVLPVK